MVGAAEASEPIGFDARQQQRTLARIALVRRIAQRARAGDQRGHCQGAGLLQRNVVHDESKRIRFAAIWEVFRRFYKWQKPRAGRGSFSSQTSKPLERLE